MHHFLPAVVSLSVSSWPSLSPKVRLFAPLPATAITDANFLLLIAIPVFDNLLSLVGALLGTYVASSLTRVGLCADPPRSPIAFSSMTVIVMSPMWFWDNASRRHTNKTLRYQALFGYNIFVLFFGFFLAAAGTYGSIVALINSSGNGSFSCADNSV